MGSSRKPPKEDPAVAELRKREQKRAEIEKVKALQVQLGEETLQRSGGLGIRSTLGPLGLGRGRSLLGGG